MHITVEPRDSYSILHLRGEFDTFYCPLLQQEVESLQGAGVVNVVLNMRLVRFINSTALGAVIKASKALGGVGGKLVIARPSPFVRDVMEKVGLDRIVPIYDSDESAGASFASVEEAPAPAGGELPDDDESSIIFTLLDESRVKHFIPEKKSTKNPLHGHKFGKNWRGIGRMSGLDAEGVRFTWSGGTTGLSPFEMGQMLALGTELKVKFRLNLLQRGMCEAVVTIEELQERPDGVKVGATFSEIDDETRDAVEQYAKDMAFLKKELRQATED